MKNLHENLYNVEAQLNACFNQLRSNVQTINENNDGEINALNAYSLRFDTIIKQF